MTSSDALNDTSFAAAFFFGFITGVFLVMRIMKWAVAFVRREYPRDELRSDDDRRVDP